MTLYMDVHESLPDSTTAADVAGAHSQDLAAVHREAHGLVADRLFPVVQGQ